MRSLSKYTDALELSLGRVVADARRQIDAEREKANAFLHSLTARLAESEARNVALHAEIRDMAAARLAEVKDGRDGKDADPVDVDALHAAVSAGVDTAREAAFGAISAKMAEIDAMIAARMMEVRNGVDGKDGLPGDRGADGQPGERGEKGEPGESVVGDKGERGEKGEPGRDAAPVDMAEVERLIGARVAEYMARVSVDVAARLADVRDGKDGADGRDGADGKDADPDVVAELVGRAVEAQVASRMSAVEEKVAERLAGLRDGKDGKLPAVKEWADGVHYTGDVVTYRGGTYQARKDTGTYPLSEDWACLAAPGLTPKTLSFREAYEPGAEYEAMDVVMLKGSSWVAIADNPGDCPGDGWKLLAQRGGSGGRGEPGPRGLTGAAGRDAGEVVGVYRDGEEIVVTLASGVEYRA